MAAPQQHPFGKCVLQQTSERSPRQRLNPVLYLYYRFMRNQPRLIPTDCRCRNQRVLHPKPGMKYAQVHSITEPKTIIRVKVFRNPGYMQVSYQGIHTERDVRYRSCYGPRRRECGSDNRKVVWNYPCRWTCSKRSRLCLYMGLVFYVLRRHQ